MSKRKEKIKEIYNKSSVRKFFVKHSIMLAVLFFIILTCFLTFFVFDYLDTPIVYIIILILLGVFGITFLVLTLFKNKEDKNKEDLIDKEADKK